MELYFLFIKKLTAASSRPSSSLQLLVVPLLLYRLRLPFPALCAFGFVDVFTIGLFVHLFRSGANWFENLLRKTSVNCLTDNFHKHIVFILTVFTS